VRQVLDCLHEQASRLEDIMLSSNLPDEPDHDAVDWFLVDAYQRVWAGELDQG
jgi:hypothetical protein